MRCLKQHWRCIRRSFQTVGINKLCPNDLQIDNLLAQKLKLCNWGSQLYTILIQADSCYVCYIFFPSSSSSCHLNNPMNSDQTVHSPILLFMRASCFELIPNELPIGSENPHYLDSNWNSPRDVPALLPSRILHQQMMLHPLLEHHPLQLYTPSSPFVPEHHRLGQHQHTIIIGWYELVLLLYPSCQQYVFYSCSLPVSSRLTIMFRL